MKKQFILIIALVSFLFLSGCTKTEKDQKMELLEVIAQFNSAFQNGDVATLESMITEDYSHTNGNAKVIGKKAWLKYLKKRSKNIQAGKIKVLDYAMDELTVQMLENTAIVTAKIQVKTQKEDITYRPWDTQKFISMRLVGWMWTVMKILQDRLLFQLVLQSGH